MENTTVVDGRSGIIEASGKLVIKNFVEVMGGFKPGMFIESDPFMLGDTPLVITVYPNGDVDDCEGHVSLFLHNNGDEDISVKGLLTASLKGQLVTVLEDMNFDYTETVRAGGAFGVGKFLTHAECAEAHLSGEVIKTCSLRCVSVNLTNNNNKNKDFVVEAKLEIPGEVTKIDGRQSPAGSKEKKFNVLQSVYNKMSGADFTLVFEGEEVPCHKIVLAAASPVLEAMVENKHREAIESKANIKISAEVGRAFLRYIYVGEVQEDLMKEHTSAFLEMAEMYELNELKDMAEKALLSQLDKENMVEMVYIGELFRAEDIFEAALKMTKINMTWLRNQVYSTVWKVSIRVT